ncbi:MAG: M14 family metallopeptidase [Proteobacteria bacterium]|nr:M14 family metallopeptidase [Pseudomonadota bacterium]
MIGVVEAFSPSYATARQKFLQACAAAGLQAQAHEHPLKGRDGEDLAMDVARDGPADAKHLLIVSSACHGVEGHCGSGVQVFALHDQEWRSKAREAGVAVLYVHALNPHGFSHRRRVTQENVDLNRNFFDFDKPLPINADYAQLHELLLSGAWPPTAENQAAIDAWIAAHGIRAYQTAVTAGQYQFPDGMFFGGNAPTWSNKTFRKVLREHGRTVQGLAWIDLHTGLGPNGHGERIFACKDDKAAYARANAWWGAEHAVTSIYDGSSTSALLNGLMWNSIYEECPQAEFTAIALEYGTLPMLEVTGALRADHWMHKHPGKASPELAASIREKMLEAFYTDTDAWKGQIISQARQAMFQAVDGLARA